MKGRIALLATIVLLAGSLSMLASSEGSPTRTITGKDYRSSGLLSSGSFTAVEAYDHDNDGKDEIYLGGAGRNNPKTQGIRAYEYDPSAKTWSAYGSGLPDGSSGDYYGALGVGDVNKDGYMDIIAPSQTKWYSTSSNKVEVFTSNSQGSFTLSHTFSPGKSTTEAEIADLDGDSNMDIVYTYDGGVKVQFGSGSSTSWTDKSPTSTGIEMDGVGIGDLNGDGLLDMVSTNYQNSNVYIYIQGSSRTWTSITKSAGSVSFGAKIADLNGDGYNDIVVGTRSGGIKVWGGNGGGSIGGTSFSWTNNNSGLPSSGGDWSQIELGDIDRDGDLDLIASRSSENRTRVYMNHLPNSWAELFSSSPLYLGSGADAYGANFGDWNGDGQLDIVACSWGGGADAWIVTNTSTPQPENQLPMPHAGADIHVMLGGTVRLDGRNSTDPDDAPSGDTAGSILKYEWNFTSAPSSSAINDNHLSPSDNVARPSFTPDSPGTYKVTLAVNDGEEWSNESDEDEITITVTKPNDPPIARTGMDLSGYVGDTYVLDGTGSYDIDGTITAYDWTCTSHTVSLKDQTTSTPEFVPSQAVTYRFTLRVMDNNMTWSLGMGLLNVTATILGENLPPIADAVSHPSVFRGDMINLDGSGSMDPDGTIISFDWICTSHSVTFTGQNTSFAFFEAEEDGIYVVSLRVEDSNHTWSNPDTLEVLSVEPYINIRPVADAGGDLEAFVLDSVVLNGSGSLDPNGQIVHYNWTCTSHEIELSEKLTATPSFIPTLMGIYVFTLAVSDNEGAWSPEDEVIVTVSEKPVVLVDIKLGPFLYTDNTPVASTQLRLYPSEGNPLLGVVISDGTSSFSGLLPGPYTIELLKDGEVILGPLNITVKEDGSILYSDGPIPRLEKDNGPGPTDDDDDDDGDDDLTVDDDENNTSKDDNGPWPVVLPIIFVLVVAGGVVAFIVLTKKNENDADEEGSDICPDCGASMEFKVDFNKHYCEKCGKYHR